MARLITTLLFLVTCTTTAHAFDTEVEIVFPYKDIKSGIVIGIDKTHEHMLYPVHTYNPSTKNQVGFFKKPKSELSRYIERSLPKLKDDMLPKTTNLITPHSYAVKINGQFLNPNSKHIKDLILKLESQPTDTSWKGIKYETYTLNPKTNTLTRTTYDTEKKPKTKTDTIQHLCTLAPSQAMLCQTDYGTLRLPPQKR